MLYWDLRKLTSFGVKERQGGHHDYNDKGEREGKYGGEVEECEGGGFERVDGKGIPLVVV
jgi:hypothetical protein